jgi:hypothetical protein
VVWFLNAVAVAAGAVGVAVLIIFLIGPRE